MSYLVQSSQQPRGIILTAFRLMNEDAYSGSLYPSVFHNAFLTAVHTIRWDKIDKETRAKRP